MTEPRDDGEVGGHTLRESERSEPASLGEPKHATSMDVPMPEAGAAEAQLDAGMESREGEGSSRTPGSPGTRAMKPTGTGNRPTSRTQRAQADAASAAAAEHVLERAGVEASRPLEEE
jgi:hypothetical protein